MAEWLVTCCRNSRSGATDEGVTTVVLISGLCGGVQDESVNKQKLIDSSLCDLLVMVSLLLICERRNINVSTDNFTAGLTGNTQV